MPQVGLEGSRGGRHVHFALQIPPGDFDQRVATLRAAGHDAPVHEFGPLGSGDRPSRSVYVTDPDGHLVEFWTADMADYR
jgi:catechol 2,3-dioxygenase-like lactoylglutathione lyase family enzyme